MLHHIRDFGILVALTGFALRRRCQYTLERRQAPNATDLDHGIAFMGGGRGGPAHLLDLRCGKGKPLSNLSIFFWGSSFFHGHFPQLLLEPGDFQVPAIVDGFFQGRLPGLEKLLPPA
jgi:hypothetical protein